MHFIFCLFVVMLIASPALAEEKMAVDGEVNKTAADDNQITSQEIYHFAPIQVVADRPESGVTTIDADTLRSQPSRTGSISELLKSRSNVQFSNQEESSATLGEIRPPRISIAGSKPYESSFLIDGLSVTNRLDPSGLDEDGDAVTPGQLTVNGADQTIFYDAGLLDSVTVHTSNIPAKFGGFTGGVVDSSLRDPRMDRWHATLLGRYTRSNWFERRNMPSDSESADEQPHFDVYYGLASAEGPLSEQAGLLVAASRQHSVIPMKLEHSDGSFTDKNQYRSNENFFSRLLLLPNPDLTLKLDATYAPYKEERWRASWPDSDWTVENEAWRVSGGMEYDLGWADWTTTVAYSQYGYSRDSANNYREQLTGTGVDDEDEISRGGLGDAEYTNRDLSLKLDFDGKGFAALGAGWKISGGLEGGTLSTDGWNEATTIDYTSVSSSGKRTHILSEYAECDQFLMVNTLGAYVQAEAVVGRLKLTPGLRLDYNDFSSNVDLAPRFKAEFDTFGDGSLRLVAGVNRYFGGQLLGYALDRQRPYHSTTTLSSGSVTERDGTDESYKAADLDTPYSDEYMAGLVGEVAGFSYGLEFVHRNHRDQLMSVAYEEDVYELTNGGRSSYDGISLELSRSVDVGKYGRHLFSLGLTKAWYKTFQGGYNSNLDSNDEEGGYPYGYDQVYYNGELVDASDLPAEDYNGPLIVTFGWQVRFWDDRLRVHSSTRWRDSTTGLVKDVREAAETPYGTTASKATSSVNTWLDADGSYHKAYKNGVISGSVMTDMSVEFDAIKEEQLTLTLLLDVFNLFDSTGDTGVAEIGVPRDIYGRGFYAGMRCEF